MAIQAAASSDAIAGAIAICPAGADAPAARAFGPSALEMRIDPGARESLEAWLAEHDLREAVELMGSKPLLLIHARGDDQIPSEWSEELYARARRAAQADPAARRPPPLRPARRRAPRHRPALAGAKPGSAADEPGARAPPPST